MTITIRPFREEDFNDATAVWNESAHTALPSIAFIQSHTLEDDRAYFRRTYAGKADIWVAELDDRIAGLMVLVHDCVEQLFVATEAQGQGVGAALLDRAKALWPGGLRLYTHQVNQRARRFYEAHGFHAIHFGVSPAPESEPDIEYHWPGNGSGRSALSPDAYLDALMGLPGMWGPQASPDGRWVAWTWLKTAPTAEVYAVPTDGSSGPIRLTDTPEDTYFVSWAPDSRSVVVEQDEDGNERVQLFRVDVDRPLDMQPLTEPQPNYFIRGGDLHPDGRTLVYGANVDFSTGQEIEPIWIYRHDLETGERVALARPLKGGYIFPELSPDGQHVMYRRKDLHPAGLQIWLVGIDGEDDREILNFGAESKVFAHWLADSSGLVFLAETHTHRRLGLWSLADGTIRWLIDDPARNIENAFMPRNGRDIVVVNVTEASRRPSLLNPQTGAETTLPALPGNLNLLAPLPSDDVAWAGSFYSSRQPVDIVRFTLADGPSVSPFTSLSKVWERTALTPGDLTAAVRYQWESVDGLPIQGWLYRPPGKPIGTIVYVHGGPTAHSEDAANPQIQYFVRRGFMVLDPNYRGSTGFGVAFREAIKEDGWGGREQEDIRTGIASLIERGLAERGKVGVTGTSYGGYSSWCAITRFPPELLAAAAPICGMTDLVVDYYTTRPDLRPYSEEMLGGTPEQAPERYHERSPIHFVGDIRGQLLIVQGDRDPNVTPENVRAVREALDAARIRYEVLTFADEGHGIGRPANQRVLFKRLGDFFDEAFD